MSMKFSGRSVSIARESARQHEVVAVNQLGIAGIAKPLRDFGARRAGDAHRFSRTVVAEPARNLAPLRIDAGDKIAALELAFNALDADRQQTASLFAQNAH